MKIGIPKEIRVLEGRVGLIPAAAGQLVAQGHEVYVEKSAGVLSGYSDAQYAEAGVNLVESADELFDSAEMIVKVKEPQPPEVKRLRSDHILFSYLHLAADLELMQALQKTGATTVAFETVETDNHLLPLLAPMSDIAGRVAVQVGTHLLHQPQGGKGLLLGGLPAAERGKVVVLGAGVAGGNSAAMAAALGAEVTVFDINRDRLAQMRALGNNVTALYPYPDALNQAVAQSDLLIGAILIPGKKAQHLVSREMVQTMGDGGVIMDISVDQGGCIETTRPTDYAAPTFVEEGVTHFGVTNMPGAVPRTASQALSAALIPYVSRLAQPNWREDAELVRGINVEQGEIVHPALKDLVA
jgi:alanine dehydrogenase